MKRLFKKIKLKRKTNISNLKKRAKQGSIRKQLIIIPLIVVLVGIAGVGAISSILTRNSLLNEMRQSGLKQSADFLSRMEDNDMSVSVMNNLLDEKILMSANIIRSNQDELSNMLLTEMAANLFINEINYYDATGTIVYSNKGPNVGYVPEAGSAPHVFHNSTEPMFMEEMRQDVNSDDFLKYGYIRNGSHGFIQIGLLADRFQQLNERFDAQTLLDEIGSHDDIAYALLVDRDLEVIGHSNKDLIGQIIDDEGNRSAAVDQTLYAAQSYYVSEDRSVYEVSVPAIINGRYVGAISIGFSMANVELAIGRNIRAVAISGLIAFLILGLILFLLSNGVIRVIHQLREQMGFMAQGDFSQDIPKALTDKDNELGEISRAIATMQASMQNIIRNVLGTSEQLAASSEELTATSDQSAMAAEEVAKVIEDISQGASDQATETEQGVASITELGGLVKQNKMFIEHLDATAEKIDELKDEGLRVLGELVDKTNMSRRSAYQVSQIILETNESTGDIARASEMIQSIADQTNLLALNATIEAARAGESGRGFAVVASEIKTLAEQSNQFASDINAVIKTLTEKTAEAVETMEEGSEIIASQSDSVTTTTNKFDGIAETIDEMQQVIDHVSKSSDHMAERSEYIITVMEQLSAISEENAAGTQEAAASVEEQTASTVEIAHSSEDLARIAEELNIRMNEFTI